MNNIKSWTIDLMEDPDTGDLMLPLPSDTLTTLGWVSGDTLNWKNNGDGSFTIYKKHDTNTKTS